MPWRTIDGQDTLEGKESRRECQVWIETGFTAKFEDVFVDSFSVFQKEDPIDGLGRSRGQLGDNRDSGRGSGRNGERWRGMKG